MKLAAKTLAALTLLGLSAFSAAQTKLSAAFAASFAPAALNNSATVVGNAKGYLAGIPGLTVRPYAVSKGKGEYLIPLAYLGMDVRVVDINESGTILGYAEDANGKRRAFTAKNDKVTEIGEPTWRYVDPISIAANGTVVGTASDAKGTFTFVYSPNDGWRRVEIPGATWNYPAKVQSNGLVLIRAMFPAGDPLSYIFDSNKNKLTPIDFGGVRHQIITMNEGGDVLCYQYLPSGTRTVIWSKGTIQEVFVPGATVVYGWDLNASGTVVGVAFDDQWRPYGFVAPTRQLPYLLDDVASASSPVKHFELATKINAGGAVIAESLDRQSGGSYLFEKTNK